MAQWITTIMNSLGYGGIALLMFLENLFPPIPSELIMPLAGFTVAQGQMNFTLAVLAGLAGTLLGALPWYYVGYAFGEERIKQFADRYGRWLTLSSQDIEKANRWFDRNGKKAVLTGRLVPGVRTLISLPAGLNRMPFIPFLFYTSLGSVVWIGLLTFAGYALGNNYALVERYIGPLSKIILLALVIFVVFWIVKRQRRD
ncbi:DedA family protein [Desertifilum sp. FACHB-1129]|uniref:Alkaline phosphatase n=1 Tax=Desertifilum tharense IPPAS B-1220 TaxID=1781255 RepID=A0A1E5QPL9_9CYAN|nr:MULTISPECIES: DedA family protein [Desertifilum]MDA0211277.1 DedA family protein [Cyanobacteria bacterium FC1]MBD2312758.1 DedA family protein [Desertifilum sp. FACHB-1129]MBD2320239.1 DedA family protein [Desertifilum sp. FACHB-866]MBD2330367.1 DedA family protein [Desertifilum sp. FACHB-868]OEJ76554.1 alkaline phosphatase [Desertifilum tharense IPPAS B-1220]